MKAVIKYLLVAATATALAGAGTLVADAGWSIPGTARVKIPTSAMPRGATPSAAVQGRTAVVSWSAQEIVPGVKMDHYVVTAHNVNDLPDVVHTVAASGAAVESLAFTSAEVGDGGKWYWTIVPKFHLWAGAESGKSQRLTLSVASVAAPLPAATLAPTTSPTPSALPTSPSAAPPPQTTPPATTSPVVESASPLPTEIVESLPTSLSATP